MATLDRAIGPFAATLLVIGGIIGSGIFLTTGPMAAALPSATLLVVLAGGTAAVAVGFAEYFSYFFPALSSTHIIVDIPLGFKTFHIARSQCVAVSAIAVLGAINYVGVRSGSGTNAVLTIAKI